MHNKKLNLLAVWSCLTSVSFSMLACSGDSGSNPSDSELGNLNSTVLIDGNGLPVASSAEGVFSSDGNLAMYSSEGLVPVSSAIEQNPLFSSSSNQTSFNEGIFSSSSLDLGDGSHDGPIQGEDPNQQPVLTPLAYKAGFPVIISEVSPSNASFKDNDGNDPGWMELYNTSDAPVDLKGVALSNDTRYPRRWVFGNATIPAKSFMVVFLSGKNYADYIAPSDSVYMIGSDCQSEESSVNNGFGDFGNFWGGDMGGGFGDMGGGFGDMGGGNMGGGNANGGANITNLPNQSSLCFNQGGANMFGGVLKVAAGGSYSRIVVKSTTTNLSKIDQLVIRGYVTKNHKIRVNFKEGDNLSAWSGKNLKGTGDSSSTYYVRLGDNARGVNLSNISATTFATETEGSESTVIKVVSYIARNRGREPHTTFKSEKNGGSIYLVNEANEILDSVRYNGVPAGTSWSRDDDGKWGISSPTPYGSTIGDVYAEQVSSADVSVPPSGFYTQPFSVTFPTGTRCAQGGTEPTMNSADVSTMQISATTVLRCRTFVGGSYPSEEINRTYVFEQQPSIATIFVTTDPLSMFSPDSGLYMKGNGASMMEPYRGANYWSNRELPVYVEFFEPGTPKKPAFGVKGDFKISGQYSRAKEKKSFSFTLREEYGEKRLKYPLFPDYPEYKKFKAFSVRNFGNNCGNDYIRDRLATSMTEGLNVDYQRGRYVIVYYNGEYFGIHDLRERNNEYYYEYHYDVDPNNVDLIDADNVASTGSGEDFKAMIEWLKSNSLTDDVNYQKIADQIDVDNFMNYMQAEMFANNRDWPHNNMKKWRIASEKSKWKWFLYDTDFGFGTTYSMSNGSIFEYVTSPSGTENMGFGMGMGAGNNNGDVSEHTILIRRLLENASFKNAFVNRFCVLISMNFASSRLLQKIETLQSQVQAEVSRDQSRWDFNSAEMEGEISTIKNFASSRGQTILSEMSSYFNLGSTVKVSLAAQGAGRILVNNLPLDQASMTIDFFSGVPVTVTAVPNSGVFTGWSDGDTQMTRTFNPGEVTSLTAVFK